MGVLADWQIEALAKNHGMIDPYDPGDRKPGKISSGTSSYGYDVRVGYKFKVFSPICATVIDPKNFDPKMLVEVDLTPKQHKWVPVQGKRACLACASTCDFGDTSKFEQWIKEPCGGLIDHILIPPHSFALGESVETFDIPRDILVVVLGKSTYARSGIIVNVTPGEPEWKGKWTIEVSNTTPLPAKIYPGEGLMQALFFRADQVCRTSYADKKGKYQDQKGLTLPKAEPK